MQQREFNLVAEALRIRKKQRVTWKTLRMYDIGHNISRTKNGPSIYHLNRLLAVLRYKLAIVPMEPWED